MTTPGTLFLFAHQDDEMAAVSRIALEVARGSPVFCVFLTDGGGSAHPSVRERESAAVLMELGVTRERILFPGSQIPIPPRNLMFELDPALEQLHHAMLGIELERIYCLAWEGGHPDHDASHLVAAAFARERRMLDRCFEMPLYRAAGRRGPFFRTLSPLDPRAGWERRRLGAREGLKLSMLGFRYRSQWKSWIGLFPETLVKLALMRREVSRPIDPGRLRRRPHPGPLLYERRGKSTFERFEREATLFLDRHLPPLD